MLYHGSSAGGLTELKPFISEHGKPYIYFSSNPVVALFYTVHAVERPYNWFPYGFKDGIPVYNEYYPDALADIYKGKTGFLYEFDSIQGAENPTEINCACVCKTPVSVGRVIEVSDVYEALIEYEKRGELVIERYENLNDEQKKRIEKMMKSEIESFELRDKPDCSYTKFLESRFPNLFSAL